MSQGAVIIPGSPLTGANLCADVNSALAAAISQFSGGSAPTLGPGTAGALVAGQNWINTTATTYVLSTHDGTSFVPWINLDSSNHVIGANFSSWVGTAKPVTLSGTSGTQLPNHSSIIINPSNTFTLTLITPSAANAGQWLYLKTIDNFAVNSAGSNVVPLAGGAASTPILTGTAGKWAALQSDGTDWVIMAGN